MKDDVNRRFRNWWAEVIRIGKLLGKDTTLIEQASWRRWYFERGITPARAWQEERDQYMTVSIEQAE